MFAYKRKKRLPVLISSKKLRRSAIGLKAKWPVLLFWGFFVLFSGTLIWFFIFSPYFRIKEVSAIGADEPVYQNIKKYTDNFLKENILKFFPGDNFFLFSADNLKESMLKNFPAASEVQIKKFFPKKIEVVFKEREAAAIFCKCLPVGNSTSTQVSILPVSDGCFFADSEGIIYKEAPEISGTILLTLYFPGQQIFNLGDQALASSTIRFADDLKKELRVRDIDMNVFMVSDKSGQEIKSISSEGWVAYFSGERSAIAQAKVLEALLANEIKEKRNSLEYIDLRLPNRAYYK